MSRMYFINHKLISFFDWFEQHKIFSLSFLFIFRLFYGITNNFWLEDELNIYIIGLKFYTTGEWPFFGPDVVYTRFEIPGALQGLLVGLPLFVLPIPEAPFLLLNLLSFGSLSVLALYICRRLPDMPKWLVWGGLLLNPWSCNLSTHIVNPSYVLMASIVFFISFMESLPRLTINFISCRLAFFLMGISTLWIMQLHLSWVLLPIFTAFAFFSQILHLKQNKSQILFWMGAYLLGCLLMSTTLLPTYIKYGFGQLTGSTGQNIIFNVSNYKEFFTILARYLSFGCYEIPRFLTPPSAERIDFIRETLWAAPFTIFCLVLGLIQPIVILIVSWFKRNGHDVHWIPLKRIVYGTFLLIFFSFFFSVKGPSSHAFYIFFPLVNIYAMYCWRECSQKWVYPIAALSLVSIVIFYCAFITIAIPKTSLYSNFPGKNRIARDIVSEAIQKKDYKILGIRRYKSRK